MLVPVMASLKGPRSDCRLVERGRARLVLLLLQVLKLSLKDHQVLHPQLLSALGPRSVLDR